MAFTAVTDPSICRYHMRDETNLLSCYERTLIRLLTATLALRIPIFPLNDSANPSLFTESGNYNLENISPSKIDDILQTYHQQRS